MDKNHISLYSVDRDMDYGRNNISIFLKKAYELVDDPSTDSIISWSPNGLSFVVLKPLECSRDLLTSRLQITNFSPFQSYVSTSLFTLHSLANSVIKKIAKLLYFFCCT